MQLHNGHDLGIKLEAAGKIAFILSLPAWIVTQFSNWYLTNRNYIIGVLICIIIDHIIGSIYHAIKVKDFSWKKNAIGLITKLGLCAASAVLFEIIHDALKGTPWIYEYIKTLTRIIVLLYPAGSAFMNMSALTNGIFPPVGWIKRIKDFNENLDLEKFKNGSDNP